MTTTDTARRSRSASGSPARDRCRRCDGTGQAHVAGLGMTDCPHCNPAGRKRPFERRAGQGGPRPWPVARRLIRPVERRA